MACGGFTIRPATMAQRKSSSGSMAAPASVSVMKNLAATWWPLALMAAL